MLQESSHWAILVVTHLVRSLVEDWGQSSLKSEIAVLRVEVHRAKQLVSDYNNVLESCESETRYLKNSAYLGAWINIALGVLCAGLWVLHNFWSVRRQLAQTTRADESEEGELLEIRRAGPVRPSQIVRARS